MSEEVVTTNEQEIFAQLNITKILVAVLEVQGEITVPTDVLVSAANEDKELQVNYDAENQTFSFRLNKEKKEVNE